jgi:hypothetical protein
MPQAGLLELVAHGVQDIYLIGNPQITFFKTIYKRHTNFSMEAFQISYDAKPTWGQRTTFNITRYADLMYTMIVEIDIPRIYSKYTFDNQWTGPGKLPTDFNTQDSVGIISWVNNTGHAAILYYDLKIGGQLIDRQYSEWMEIWTQLSQSESKKRGLDQLLNRNYNLETTSIAQTVYIPLQFWFCRNIGLALPLIALQYHDVELELNFRPLEQMTTFGSNLYYSATSDGTDILTLTNLYDGIPTLKDSDIQGRIIVFPDGAQYYIAPDATINPGQDGSLADPYTITMVRNIPDIPIYHNATVYIKPNGVLDTSRNTDIVEVRLYVDYIYLDTIEQREFANAKHRYLIEQLQYSGSESIDVNATTKRVKLVFNLPIKEIFWVNQLDSVFTINDLFNYSNSIAASVPPDNIIASAQITINGIERFSLRNADYFRLIQPYQKHTRSPNGYFYVYSFSVKPEEHQPSGCSNFSKLDTKELFLNIKPNTGLQQVRVYAINYNILRIMSGMGGVAFSS